MLRTHIYICTESQCPCTIYINKIRGGLITQAGLLCKSD